MINNSNTKQNFILQFQNLSNPNQQIRSHANIFLMKIIDMQEAWTIAKQLLDQQSPEYNFFGAQILNIKIRSNFQNMNIQWKLQLKTYVFNYFYNNCSKLCKPALAKITSSAAIIASYLYIDHWKTFLDDLMRIMGNSIWHLKGGLQILQNVTQQIKQLKNQSYREKQQIKKEFLRQESVLLNIFNRVFDTNEYGCIQKNLECILSWSQFSLGIMKDSNLIRNIIKQSIKSVQYFEKSCDILIQSMKYKSITSFTTLDNPLIKKQQFNQIQLNNLVLIVEFILQTNKNLYGQIILKNNDYYKIFGHLVKQTLLNFPWLVVQDINRVGSPLFQIMINTLKHKNIKVSYTSLEFWNSIYLQFKKVKNPDFDKFIVFYYVRAYQVILQKTKLKSIQNYQQQVPQNITQQSDTEQTQYNQNRYGLKISFQDYRQQAVQLYQIIYNVLYEKQTSEGIKIFFNYINQLLQASSSFHDRQTRIQLGLFATKSAFQSMVSGDYLDYLKNILQFISSLDNVGYLVKSQIFKIFNDCSKQIRDLNIFDKVLDFILRNISDKQNGLNAGFSFYILLQSINEHSNVSLIERVLCFYMQKFDEIDNDLIMERFLDGFLAFLFRLQSIGMVQLYLKNYLQFLNNRIKQCLVNKQSRMMMRILKQIKIVYNQFQVDNVWQKQIIAIYVHSQVTAHVSFIQDILLLCYDHQLIYSEQNQIGIIQNIIKSIIKLFIKQVFTQILSLLNISIKFIVLNVKQYSNLLGIFIFLIDQISLNKQSYQTIRHVAQFDTWLTNNYYQFNNFYLNKLETINDPDVIKNFIRVQQRILYYKQQFFFTYNLHHQIIQTTLYTLAHIYQTYMTKYIILFLFKYVHSNNTLIYPNYNNIFQIIMMNIPKIQSINYPNIAKILIKISKMFDNLCANISYLLQKCQLVNVNANNVMLLSKALEYYLTTGNQINVKLSLLDIYSLYKGTYSPQIFLQIQMRLQSAKNQNRMKK